MKKNLTSLFDEARDPEVTRLLEEAGLEVWESPEGFRTVRLKAVVSPMVVPETVMVTERRRVRRKR